MKLKLKIIAALVLFSIVKSYAQQADFSGKWKLDTLKSDYGKVPHFVIFDQATIRQTKDSIELITVSVNNDGHDGPATSVTYALNGNPNQRILQDTIKVVGSCEFTDDKKALIKKMSYTSKTGSQGLLKTIQDNWSLSSDGKELTVYRVLKSFNKQEASYAIQVVYDK